MFCIFFSLASMPADLKESVTKARTWKVLSLRQEIVGRLLAFTLSRRTFIHRVCIPNGQYNSLGGSPLYVQTYSRSHGNGWQTFTSDYARSCSTYLAVLTVGLSLAEQNSLHLIYLFRNSGQNVENVIWIFVFNFIRGVC